MLTQPAQAAKLKGGFPPWSLINWETDRKCITYRRSPPPARSSIELQSAPWIPHPPSPPLWIDNAAVFWCRLAHRGVMWSHPRLSLGMREWHDKSWGLINLLRGFWSPYCDHECGILSSVAETTARTAAFFFSPPLTTTWDFQSNKVKNTPFTQCSVSLFAIFTPWLELLCDTWSVAVVTDQVAKQTGTG